MNILYIVCDQLRYDALGSSGNAICRTPALDGLAASGARFARAYTPCALCSPARASLLTGRFPHRHGILTNTGQYQTRTEMDRGERTFAQPRGGASPSTPRTSRRRIRAGSCSHAKEKPCPIPKANPRKNNRTYCSY